LYVELGKFGYEPRNTARVLQFCIKTADGGGGQLQGTGRRGCITGLAVNTCL
jgi:hypothetical protein